ncbi:MAG: hypothetical protein UY23_C0005G0055 [Candidatus Jorgensenbacteria bacterium GW2011_GWA1_48_11]|uniref:Caib/baif family protein n=1 Tax=Candidatus Jorgensenbacteria bacterium GW2011_GWA1_48_11 TaxID=1618660 RepID=A0A0G1UA19_9BACT|nr:MAG: hypothetical protein UY23_C0005G0055 [Candidatus Jorgensenbacteria bacterium GW2011_GWA1_48_11]KKW12310.1 MAG: hypothetical protein UY51_C0005G0552 [Candidatus Jorgensenbacteria bacterium GW2011_GWB1_49_9]
MNFETKTYSTGSVSSICQNCKNNFVIEPEDFKFYEKIHVPPPTFCFECRAVRRLNFWNEHNLLRNVDNLTGKEIFSTYPKSSGLKVYERDYWWSDKWDPMEYGRDYDFARPFFEQFKELFYAVPWPSRSIQDLVNSDYCDQATGLKNCYLCFNGGFSEDSLYGVAFQNMRNSVDFYAAISNELCYEGYQLGDSYRVFFGEDVFNCVDSWFLLNCTDCQNCFGCVNLRHKKYHIFNKPYSKEAYGQKLKEFNLGSYRSLMDAKDKFEEFRLRFPVKYIHSTTDSVNVSGDYVYWGKNANYCYEAGQLENVKFIQNVAGGVKDSYDYTSWGENVELLYESVSCGRNCQRLKFCFDCWPACQDLEYSVNCHSSSNLFGCVGLQKKQYCIFNKQYTREEYGELVAKIKKHMVEMPYRDNKGNLYKYGEFLPFEFSPLAYNETKAQDYYPLSKKEVENKNYLWRDIERREFQTTVSASDLPDRIDEVDAGVLKELIGCLQCGRAYRVIAPELEFYKRFGLPLPRLCSNCRYFARLKRRNSLKLQERACMCAGGGSERSVYKNTAEHFHKSDHCPNKFITAYSSERREIIYCEQCYNAEIA